MNLHIVFVVYAHIGVATSVAGTQRQSEIGQIQCLPMHAHTQLRDGWKDLVTLWGDDGHKPTVQT